MNGINDEVIAAVLAKCSAYDARNTPAVSGIVIDAWLEHFRLFPNVTAEDLLGDNTRRKPGAVAEYYRSKHHDQLTPVDLSDIARKYARERIEGSALDSPERLALEALSDTKAAPELVAIEAAAPVRQQAVESFARRFGIPPAEAARRMKREMGEANERDAVAVEVAHVRMARPAATPPCPDCGSTAVPCPCEQVPPNAP